ncbi:hypothetical protein F5878DRAFT_190896 [Lentinula raphanica]|uniref:Uncharacterized protein n=1 Tax=Lentinula raphanica TaxID=153919 RepID=A0AA38P7X0_9AGAR|nr:hypothetical protein F5878DRAFT_190896 [Lentinula raphanica]
MTSGCCLEIGDDKICSPTERLPSSDWEHGLEYVVILGAMYFSDDASKQQTKQQIIDSLKQYLAGNVLATTTPFLYVHRALDFLRTVDSGLEFLTTAITHDTIDNFQTIIKMEEESTSVQVAEIRRRSDSFKTGGVEISVGSEVMEFTSKYGTRTKNTNTLGLTHNFVASVYFTRPHLMKEALARIEKQAMSTSDFNPSPSWLTELARKEKLHIDKLPISVAAGWVKADNFMQLLSEEDSGWYLVSQPGVSVTKAISENTMVNWRRYRDTRAAAFLQQKPLTKHTKDATVRQETRHTGHGEQTGGPSH